MKINNFRMPRQIWWTLVIWFAICFVSGFIVGRVFGFERSACIFPVRASATACNDQPCDFTNASQGGSGECTGFPSNGQFQPAIPIQNAGGQTTIPYQVQPATGL